MRFSSVLKFGGLTALTASLSALAYAEGVNGPVDGEIGFQRAVTPVMESIVDLNVWLVWLMGAICVFVLVLMVYIMFRFREKANPVPSKTSHNTTIEIIWTLVPVLILLVMAVPSIKLLYAQDVIPEADLTIKATGNTWNWEYSYPDYENVDSFVSNIVDIEIDEKRTADGEALSHQEIINIIDARPADEPRLDGRPYLLATDAPLVVPVNKTVVVQVTSNNNLHAFAVPQFGIKIDAIPGRINQTYFKVNAGEEGTYYGQCSELCGIKHAFMPIEVQVVSQVEFDRWIANGGSFDTDFSQNETGGSQTAGMK
ncbi:MAG: cytochrome c oxidase subunit II [Acidimicrobiales bacterium]|nr:MAG: cytochrome c oxidase subunit II [Acidimicrobiales bacterium]